MGFIYGEAHFEVKDIDPGKETSGKPFDKVSRIVARADTSETDLYLDVHCELYPLEINQKFRFVLTKTLDESMGDDGAYDQSGRKTLADSYEYVMYGKVYKYEEEKNPSRVYIYASFGGLLMCLKGSPTDLQHIPIGGNVYLLMCKTS